MYQGRKTAHYTHVCSLVVEAWPRTANKRDYKGALFTEVQITFSYDLLGFRKLKIGLKSLDSTSLAVGNVTTACLLFFLSQ